MKVVILAAGIGKRLGSTNNSQPKSLLEFGGKSLLRRHISTLSQHPISEVVIVIGYMHESVKQELNNIDSRIQVSTIYNPEYKLGSVVSLWCARETLSSGEDIILMDADVLYDPRIIEKLGQSKYENVFLLDRDFEAGDEPVKLCVRQGQLIDFRKQINKDLTFDIQGESAGFFRFSKTMATKLALRIQQYIDEQRKQEPYEEAIRDLLLADHSAFAYEDVTDIPWIEIDFPEDIERARDQILSSTELMKAQSNLAEKQASKSKQLRNLLESAELEFILEAHNGISARIAEKTGFKGLWASGLALSAQFGVRDSNEASWTQVVDMLEFMSDVTNVPILLDGDTGYGNFNNTRRLVRKLEQRDIGGVCIEDKVFPKTNSFIDGEKQPLADINEFCGKIKAGKDSQSDDDFCVVARVEALIAGWDLAEALKRAEAYHQAGADAILIHSKLSRPDEVLTFAKEWAQRLPLVIIPTKYYSTPTDIFRKAGISLVIWANHMIRASIASMEQTSAQIYQQTSVVNIEDQIATVDKIFSLQGADELSRAQERYLKHKREPHAIVLAASRGHALQELTEDRPKVMLSIGGKPLLRRLVDEFKKQSINIITVVAGYKADIIDVGNSDVVVNKNFETTSELVSLACAESAFHDDMLIMYGDLLFRGYILNDLLDRNGDLVVVVDSSMQTTHVSGSPDYAYCSSSDDRSVFSQDVELQHVCGREDPNYGIPSGRWIGMLKVRNKGRKWIEEAISTLRKHDDFDQLTIPDLLNYLVDQGKKIQAMYINGHWLDVNVLEDIDRASDFTHGN